ncbi:hypothetical protein R5R35_011326 [Gryllus longicercus]|uniref:ETFB lysine methyltransferase n=1 Tax=Gryllus longicercus TaxID=2509291 RepID=A0AAN9ZGF7_9ORTH
MQIRLKIASQCWYMYGFFKTSVRYVMNADSAQVMEIEKLIKQYTCVTRNSLTPEIALHLITPSSSLWTSSIENIPFKDPFWAFYWPGGQALTRYILDNPDLVCGQRVLDVGSGCGASAIAAAMSNACTVTANDIDPVAGRAIMLNCDLNNVSISVNTKNIIGTPDDIADCILVGDMLYDEEFATILFNWLYMLRKKGKQILVGDPGRLPFIKYKNKFQCLIEYPLRDDDFTPGFSQVSIWKMK